MLCIVCVSLFRLKDGVLRVTLRAECENKEMRKLGVRVLLLIE